MFHDIVTVFLKEWNEYLHSRNSTKSTVMSIAFPVIIFGVFFPMQSGPEWIESPAPILAFAWIPLLFVSALTADSFAGERERHTLETLLASRLSDKVILFGKYSSSVSYGLAVTAMIVISGLVTVNITAWSGSVMFYPLKGVLAGTAICLLMSSLVSCAGILISLKAATVRQAHQTMSFGIVTVALAPMIILKLMPGGIKNSVYSFLNDANTAHIWILFLGGLLALNAAFMWLALKRFQRQSLIL